MSAELDYFPPSGTKYAWFPKTLNYSPWACRLSDLLLPKHHWPMSITLSVDLIDGLYHWRVAVRGWRSSDGETVIRGATKEALDACLEAERVGVAQYEKLTPEWVLKALDEGWRPPA